MLARKERLKRNDFNRFFASGRRHHDPLFTLIYAPHREFHGSVVVSKKIAAKAVDRNTLRRRVYHILRDIARANRMKGVTIILLKKEATKATPPELREAVSRILGSIENTG